MLDYNKIEQNNCLQNKMNNSIMMFTYLIISMLKIGGRSCIVFPNGKELNSRNKHYKSFRDYILKTCNVHKIITVADKGTSYNCAIVNTVILYIEKIKDTSNNEYVTNDVIFETININKEVMYNFTINIEDIINNDNILSLGAYNLKINNSADVVKLGDICEIVKGHKKMIISDFLKSGKFNAYSCKNGISGYVNEPTYRNEYMLIFSTTGSAVVNYDIDFSCTTHCSVMRLKKDITDITLEYIYNYFSLNLDIIKQHFWGCGIKHIKERDLLHLPVKKPNEEIIISYNSIIEMKEKRKRILQELDNELNYIVSKYKTLIYNDKIKIT